MSTDRLGCTDIVLWMRNDSNCVKTNIFFKQPQYTNNFCLATISCWHDCRNKCSRHDFVFYFPHVFPQINRRVVVGELDSLWPVISEQKLQNSRRVPPLFWQIAFCWMVVSTCSYRWVNRFHFGLHLTFCSALCCCGIPEVWVSACVHTWAFLSHIVCSLCMKDTLQPSSTHWMFLWAEKRLPNSYKQSPLHPDPSTGTRSGLGAALSAEFGTVIVIYFGLNGRKRSPSVFHPVGLWSLPC